MKHRLLFDTIQYQLKKLFRSDNVIRTGEKRYTRYLFDESI